MKQTKYKALIALLLVQLLSQSLVAGKPGSAGFTFLKVPWGARNAGMGDVGVALPSGLWGSFLNPASLAEVDVAALGFMHHEHIFDTRHEYIAGVLPIAAGGLSVGLDYFHVGDLEYREQASEEPIGYFDVQDYTWFAGYGIAVMPEVALGFYG